MNDNDNTTHSRQDLQRRQQPPPLPTEKTKKRKCHGNRKRQRYRRQLYAQGLDSATVEKLVQEKFSSQVQQQQQQQPNENNDNSECALQKPDMLNYNVYIPLTRVTLSKSDSSNSVDSIEMRPKRKRFILTPTPMTETTTILDQPFSQLSISQRNPKKTKTTTNDQLNNENKERPINSTEQYRPRYLKVSDQIFKQLLSNAIPNGYKIVQCLDSQEKLDFVRQMVEITHHLYFKNLQRQLWQEYYDLSSKDTNWESTITKGYAHQHNTCRMSRPRKSYIEQRRITIAHQLERLGNEFKENLLKLQEYSKQWQPSIDFNTLSHAINECVTHGQERLQEKLNYKKKMLRLNWNDHFLLRKFHQLKPNEELIQLAKKIWQATAEELQIKEQLEILRQCIFLKRLPSKTDQIVNELLTDNRQTLANPFLDEKQRATFASRCSKTIIQCKFNLMIIQIDEFETLIRHHHATLTNLQDQLSQLHQDNPHLYAISLMNSIEERREAMITRLIRMRDHKMKTFFDQAPTVADNNNN